MDYSDETEVSIVYHSIQVTNAASNAGVFNGINTQFGWSTHYKTNTAFGTLAGHDNQAPKSINFLQDSDQVDTYINDQDLMWGIK